MVTSPEYLIWILGRGFSISCGLNWVVPNEWRHFKRDKMIQLITQSLETEQMRIENSSEIASAHNFINFLGENTKKNYSHFFITTNWDTILDRVIDNNIGFTTKEEWNNSGQRKPSWLANT